MRSVPLAAWLVTGALALSAAVPAGAQEPGAKPADAQGSIDQARQIQAEVQAPAGTSRDPGPQVPAPAIGEEEMRAIVREGMGVEILDLEVVERDGQPAYAITVMNPPGNRNDAFRVATLLFDGSTGSLLGQELPAPRTVAPGLPTATTPSDIENGGREIRRRSIR